MSEFVRKPLDEKLNKANYITRIEKMESASGPRPSESVGSLNELSGNMAGSGSLIDPDGQILISSPFPVQDQIQWRTDDTQAIISRLLGFYVPDISSGLYLLGQEKDASHYGVAGLAVQGYDQDLGSYKMLLQLDSQGLSGRSFVEHNMNSTTRRSYLPAAGWQAYAHPLGTDVTAAATTTAIAAAGGTRICHIATYAPMMLRSVSVLNRDGASGRKWNWHIFRQDTQTENSAENTLSRIAYGAAAESFTGAGDVVRTITAQDAPFYLAPGAYWLAIQNEHATNTFGIGTHGAGTMGTNTAQTKTLTNPIAGDIDFVAATWTKNTGGTFVRLDGEVYGQAVIF